RRLSVDHCQTGRSRSDVPQGPKQARANDSGHPCRRLRTSTDPNRGSASRMCNRCRLRGYVTCYPVRVTIRSRVSATDGSPPALEHLLELSADLQARGVDLVVLDQGIDTSTAIGRMFFQILGAIAE